MGGHPLRSSRCSPPGAVRTVGCLALAALAAFGAGCASQGYRNHQVPAFVAPHTPPSESRNRPVHLRRSDYDAVPGGIRLIRAGRAKPTPPFTLVDESGRVHTPETLRGRVVWLDLWAVWCGTCRAEFPFVERLQQRFERNGLTVLAVCRNSTREGFVAASRKDWIHFPVIDASDQSEFPFPVHAFPTTVLIGRHGRVRGYWQGHRTAEAMEEALRYLLAEEGPRGAPAVVARGPVDESGGALPTSENVLEARLDLAQDALPPGAFFEGKVTLDVDPGWFLSADQGDGAIPLKIRFGESQAFRVLDCRLPPPVPVETSTGARAGHRGRVELPLWGLLDANVPGGGPVDLEIVATVQACDETQCLPPSDLVLGRRLWVVDPGTAAP